MDQETSTEKLEQSAPPSRVEKHYFHQSEKQHFGNAWLAVLLIGLGIVLLLNNFSVLPWEFWNVIWRFWPVLLVLIGFQTIFGRSWISSILVFIVGLCLVGFALAISAASVNSTLNDWFKVQFPWWSQTTQAFKEIGTLKTKQETITAGKYQSVEKREISIQLGSVEFALEDTDTDNLLSMVAKYSEGQGEPKLTAQLSGKTLSIDLSTEQSSAFNFAFFGQAKYDLQVGQPKIPTGLSINLGSGNGEIELDKLKVEDVNLDLGSGSIILSFTEESLPNGDFKIEIGSGNAEVEIPKEVGVSIKYDIGSGTIKAGDLTLSDEGTYTSDNYKAAAKKLDLEVAVGSGSVIIETR